MNLARVSANGQITVSIEIRKIIGQHLKHRQFSLPMLQEMGFNNKDDVQKFVDELRHSNE